MADIANISDLDFQAHVLEAKTPVLVDYWAEWCGPCKMLTPVLEDVAAEQDRVVIVKLDVDKNPATPAQYGVQGIPTLMLFKEGEVVATKVGAVTKSQLLAFIDSNL